MIDIWSFINRCSAIYDFYKLASNGHKHPEILDTEVGRLKNIAVSFLGAPDAGGYFVNGKVPPKEFWDGVSIRENITKQVVEKLEFSLGALKNQTIVMFHSYLEIIMSSLVRMILEKDLSLLKRIYFNKDNSLPFDVGALIDNKDNIISMLVEKEVRRFEYLSLDKKLNYFNKYFGINSQRGNADYSIGIKEIDSLRQDIIHSDREILVSDAKIFEIWDLIREFGMYLLVTTRQKYKIDIVWTFGDGKNYLR
ncbi:MAG: hypothetical protein WC628_00580 [Candidatus Omnitrophota bacterium]